MTDELHSPSPHAPLTLADAERLIDHASYAALVRGGMTAIAALASALGMQFGPWQPLMIIDAAADFGLAYGIALHRSRACAALWLALVLVDAGYKFVHLGSPSGLVSGFVFGFFAVRGLHGTLEYEAMTRELPAAKS